MRRLLVLALLAGRLVAAIAAGAARTAPSATIGYADGSAVTFEHGLAAERERLLATPTRGAGPA